MRPARPCTPAPSTSPAARSRSAPRKSGPSHRRAHARHARPVGARAAISARGISKPRPACTTTAKTNRAHPLVALPAAATGGAGRIADQSGTGWSTLALRAVRHASGAAPHTARARRPARSLSAAHRSQRHRGLAAAARAGARFAAFRGDTQLTSVYAQDTWRIRRATGRPRWARASSTGMRTMARSRTARQPPCPSPAAARLMSPEARACLGRDSDLTLKASLGRAVRMPTVAELYQGSIAANSIVNNDPDLAPEQSWTSELVGAAASSITASCARRCSSRTRATRCIRR